MNLNEHLDFFIGETTATDGPAPGIRSEAPTAPSPSRASPEQEGTANGHIDRTPPQKVPNHALIAARLVEDGGFQLRKKELREIQTFLAFRAQFVVEIERYSDTAVRAAYKTEVFTGIRQSLEERLLQSMDAKRNLKERFRNRTAEIAPMLRRMLERGTQSARIAVDLVTENEMSCCEGYGVTFQPSPCLVACRAALRLLEEHLWPTA
jgi:hypothetical protein